MAYLYRGVHGKHPQIEAARKGVVIPGDLYGVITPEQHNAGGFSAVSSYTSWTGRLEVAREHAYPSGVAGGVVLRVTDEAAKPSDSWHWEPSPNDFEEEDEILLHGIRIGLEVLDEHS